MYAHFNRTSTPVITITFTGEKASQENFEAYLRELEANYEPKQNIALAFDAHKALDLNPYYQLKQAQWMSANKGLIKTYCRGVAYVVPQPVLRNILGLIFKLQPSPVPFQVFETLEEGLAWCRSKFS